MSKVRINDLARELEVKSKQILDALESMGMAEGKTHSSSIEAHEAERVRGSFERGSRPAGAPGPVVARPAFTPSSMPPREATPQPIAARPEPRRIVPQPRQAPSIVHPAPPPASPAIGTRPPA